MARTGGMTDSILDVERVELRRGARVVLAGVTFAVGRGELVAVMGPSGSGKTTILRAIAGLEMFHAGRIRIGAVTLEGGRPLTGANARQLRREVGMVFQFHCLFEHLTALQNICLAPVHAHGISPEAAREHARDLLRTFGVDHREHALPRQLSGGEAQRVAIARALAVNPPLLLMDEPTASLDPARRAELGVLLQGLLRQGRTLVIATHDEDFAREFATRILRVNDGVIDLT
jgi:ABC-type polar amino acid transport system ATPase subunit